MKVWIVEFSDWEVGPTPHAVYDSEEKAKAEIEKLRLKQEGKRDHWNITEYDVE